MGKRSTFAVSRAIKKMDQAAKWIEKARALAAEGTLEALLAYCQVGYTSGNWHFPSIVTGYEHAVKHRLARLLERELPKGYHFRKDPMRPQEFILQFKGRHVAELNEYTRTITLWRSFASLEQSLADDRVRAEAFVEECEERLKRIRKDAEVVRKGFAYRILGLVHLGRLSWITRKTFEERLFRVTASAERMAQSAWKDLERVYVHLPRQQSWLAAFRESWPDALNKLQHLGFTLNDYVMMPSEEEQAEEVEAAS